MYVVENIMFNYLKSILYITDYNKLVDNLKYYDLDESLIIKWLDSLSDNKYKSKYILVSLVNKVKIRGEFIKKRKKLTDIKVLLEDIEIDSNYDEVNKISCRLYKDGCKLTSIYELIKDCYTIVECLTRLKEMEKEFYGIKV